MRTPSKKLGALVLAGALIASLAGCAGAKSSDNAITIWYRPGSLPTASIDGVKAAFPKAKITLLKTPDVDTKLASALRSNSGIPDIAVATTATFSGAQDKFVNVDDYGFKKISNEYLSWKVKAGQTKDGKQIAIPIDIGPEGFFYRADVFKAAGLPTDPAAVGKLISTWDGYRSVAEKIKTESSGFVCDAADASVYTPSIFQKGYFYYTNAGKFEPESSVNKEAFLRAASFGQDGLCLNAEPYSQDWSAGIAQNKLVGWVGPAYESVLMTTSGGTSAGKWKVTTAPGGASSQIGSNLSVFKASANPKLATQIAEWLTNPSNMAKGYAKDTLFPSTPSSYTMTEMTQPDSFFGGQVTSTVLAGVAKEAPTVYVGSNSNVAQSDFNAALTNIVKTKASPDAAYAAAAKQAANQ
ncbi:MAG: extracellular solute-binding protein family 1 [Frondihabitans sp.]|nr:extracellular solute-binding protein family 1 [Frondihabitans sp.]